jgi:LCP family protein required for cell wall assembly
MSSRDPRSKAHPRTRAASQRERDELLLRKLLAQPPAPGHFAPSAARRRLRFAVLGVLAVLALGALLVAGRTALALYTIQQNVAAMRLPTAGAARPTSAAIVPLAAARPGTGGSQTRPDRPTTAPPTTVAQATAPAPAPPATPSEPTAPPAPSQAEPTLTPVPRQLGDVGAPAVAWGRPRPTVPMVVDQPPGAGQALTLLLLGIDRRPDETGPARSDAIIVARIDPERRRVALLSLPRDLIVDIPGYGRARINAASVYGELYPQLGGGVELERKTVSNLLGIPIDYVAQIDFSGFTSAVDAIGGVDITVEKELYDPEYPTMDYGYMEARFLPGPQHMDGATALIYSRIRHMDTIWDRNRRQQQVLLAIARRVREQNPLAQVQSLASLTTALRDYIQTDLPMERMVGLAWALRDLAPESVELYALDGNMIAENVDSSDPYAEYALPGAIESLTARLMNGPVR